MALLGALAAGAAGGAAVHIVISAVDNFSRTFTKAQTGMAGIAKAGGIAVIAGAALAGGMVLLAKKAGEVETGFAKVNTLLDEGQDAQKLFSNFVEETNIAMGNQGNQLDVLSGLYQTISAGITDTTEAQTFMNAASKTAVGGSAELSSVILAGTKAMAGFGLGIEDTDRIFDVFAGTVKAGQTTMGELANAFPNVAGMAGEAGLTIEETMGVFAGLTKVLASSDETATALSATIRAFIKPSEAMKEIVTGLGFESASAMIKEKGLTESLKMLNGAVDGDTEAMGELFPNVRALKAVFPLLGTAADDVAASIDIVSNSTGLANKQYEDMTDTLEYKWGVAMSKAENGVVSIGNVMKEMLIPVIGWLTRVIEKVVNWWENLSDGQKKAVGIITAVTAGLLVLSGVVLLVTAATAAFTAINLWWIAGIIAAIAVGYLLIKNWDKIKETATKLGMEIRNVFIGLHNVVVTVWNGIIGIIEGSINRIIGMINVLIKGLNKIPGIDLGVIADIDFGRFKGEMMKYATYTPQAPSFESGGGTTNIINIDNLNGFNARDIADNLQDELGKKVNLG